ncbi:DUF6443 domain-containing protein [Dyadobacter pollutisoli]|uniref:DUF6443 domain-containing protein n=1 Tax=Dyadobacter pollutisoli TaxID=2910158 RepID=A0A9E8NIL2_9BACT|nr:DUF6443 domain-containing protein [Dyadobacter pollutisoli]WAC14694.1 DUF6443 domain-containing protein [Dyadobacter pollutisoli]
MNHFHKSIIMLLGFLAPFIVRSQQTNSQNYIISKIYKQAGANENDVSQVVTQVRYIDGLGRPLQNVGVKQSPTGNDLVQPVEYDNIGRKAKDYLPYVAAGNGAYHANAPTAVGNWYTTNSAGLQKFAATDLDRPFTETYFEQSLNRPTGGRAPGNRSASSSTQYSANTANEVKRYDYNVGANTIAQNGTYGAGTLTKVQDTDEQGVVTSQYLDKAGQMVCKHDPATGYTYYVFDNLGLLRGVLQPKFQDDANFGHYAFLYDYDSRNRIVRKQTPGAGAVEIVYDKFDRPALSRDANQLARNMWGFTKYDSLNRPIATGEIASTDTRVQWVTTVNAIANHHETRNNAVTAGYSLNQTAPTGANEVNLLTITFYDDYAFSKPAGWAFAATYYPGFNGKVKGQRTGGRVRMLPGNGAVGGWLSTVTYYDAEYRPIQFLRQLHDLGATAYERVSIKYKFDLATVVEEQKTEQVLSVAVTHTHLATYSYDHADRMLSVKEKIITGTKTKEVYTVAHRYNDLGQLQSKWLHSYNTGTKYRRRIDYTNNIRGWQTDAKTVYKPAGVEVRFYATHVSYRNSANYSNGSVDSLAWRGKDEIAFSAGLKFTYDGASRLAGSTGIFGNTNIESGITYDKNGNITTLARSGVAVDNLTYTYLGNRLSAVGDASGNNTGVKSGNSNYLYDADGNMLTDGNRGATLTYNYLNLPKTVTVGANPAFTYDYDASGAKHKYVNTTDAFTAKYAGIVEYDGTNVFKRGATSEGQVILTPDSLTFNYYIKDYLGNVRIVFNEKGEILQNTEYYPFGLAIPKDTPTQTPAARNLVNRYLYNEKELQVGSGYLDYGARMYMPELGRWNAVDPLSEVSSRWSPYAYGNNNPFRFIDPDGMLSVHVNEEGTVLGNYNDGDQGVYLHEGAKSSRDYKKDYDKKTNTSANGEKLGELGSGINVDKIYSNILEENSSEAEGMGLVEYYNKVKNGAEWDYKNRANTIFGLVNRLGDNTKFVFEGNKMEAQDIGNHHYGVLGRAAGFNERLLLEQAGVAQIRGGTSMAEWQNYKWITVPGSAVSMPSLVPLPPYGDDPRDQRFIKNGFNYFNRHNRER